MPTDQDEFDPSEAGAGFSFDLASSSLSIEDLLIRQKALAETLMEYVSSHSGSLTVDDIRALTTTINQTLSAVHKTGGLLSELTTYRSFLDTVLEFLQRRQDSIGTDLLRELRQVAESMRTEQVVDTLLERFGRDRERA